MYPDFLHEELFNRVYVKENFPKDYVDAMIKSEKQRMIDGLLDESFLDRWIAMRFHKEVIPAEFLFFHPGNKNDIVNENDVVLEYSVEVKEIPVRPTIFPKLVEVPHPVYSKLTYQNYRLFIIVAVLTLFLIWIIAILAGL